MPRLSSRHRERLTATDGRDHVALVALDPAGQPVAIARYIRLHHDPRCADIAAEVLDGRQRQGVATDLVGRLARRAAAAGVERFTATVLSETRIPAALRAARLARAQLRRADHRARGRRLGADARHIVPAARKRRAAALQPA